MKAPETIQEFKKMLNSMQHRERFIFNLNNDLGLLEVYATITNEGFGEKNIYLQIVNEEGNQKPKNKLLKLWSNEYFEQIFKLLKQ